MPSVAWATKLGGNDNLESGHGVAVEPSTGNALVTGIVDSQAVSPFGAFTLLCPGVPCACFAELGSSTGNVLEATLLSASQDQEKQQQTLRGRGYGIAVTASGDALVTGSFSDNGNEGGKSVFLTKLKRVGDDAAKLTGQQAWAMDMLMTSSMPVGGEDVDVGFGVAAAV